MIDMDSLIEELRAGSLAPNCRFDAPLGPLTTYRVGGAAAVLVTVESEADIDSLCSIVSAAGSTSAPVLCVGRGSNLLVADAGFAGVAIVLGPAFSETWVEGTTISAGGAAKLPVVARTAVQAGLRGFEWAVGVPGSVGGAVRMNAGGHGAEIADSILGADIIDLADGTRSWQERDALELSYRSSSVTSSQVVLGARFKLELGDPVAGKAEMMDVVQWRRANQPGGANAGSVFTNPEGDSAGRLIETAGAKGLRIGTAEVSDKHANFIQADDSGTAADVRAVMAEIQRLVQETHGVWLEPETHMVGFPEIEDGDTP